MQNNQEDITVIPILKLNDDCLLEVFSYFTPKEVMKLENVCTTFERVAQMFYRTCTTMNVNEYLDEKEILEELSRKIGSYVRVLRSTMQTGGFLTAQVVKLLLPCYTNLEHLYLEEIAGLMDLAEHMAFLFTKLKTANLINCELSDEVGAWIQVATKIESLSLASNYIRGSFLPSMKHLSNLKEIDLSRCDKLESQYFLELCKNHPGLKSLGLLQWEHFSQMCVDTIFDYLKELETLKIGHLKYDKVRSKIKYDILADLPKLIHLEFLSCSGCNYFDLLMLLAYHDQLEYLHISLKAQDTYKYLAYDALIKFTKLKKFSICCFFLNKAILLEELLIKLKCKKNLEEVVIMFANVTNKGIYQFIRMCPKLNWIDLYNCKSITHEFLLLLNSHDVDWTSRHPLTIRMGVLDLESSDEDEFEEEDYEFEDEEVEDEEVEEDEETEAEEVEKEKIKDVEVDDNERDKDLSFLSVIFLIFFFMIFLQINVIRS
ncbi:hypothetical protein DMENIID0001_033970 [Sergentomyia squamirostris]